MAKLSEDLKAYMSNSQSKEPFLSGENNSRGSFSFGKLNPFKKSQQTSYDDTSEVANSWFSQAQKDPLCPGLVTELLDCVSLKNVLKNYV
ncbi:hypothetical protein DPMN_122862 [Dreissena polymorpha]|uniref:Uncharacterized protein n=1 Tax=Dreissena polymorpha TaxID=45954 RepID=A0A9D4JSD7_DREPO|nr:hypothetical protein DPMN_122862 [Dreissena polymorpha]